MTLFFKIYIKNFVPVLRPKENDTNLIPGIIIGYNVIPVDEKILDLCVTYNCDRNKVKESVINNKYNSY